jgi:regulator of sigma E protease
MTVITWIAAFIFVLGSAVILHEFGHFIIAKLLKIRVETFSAGFGPRLFGYKWGTTDYRISAIPLGGYVKLGGDDSNATLEGESASDIPPEEQFCLRPRWQRFLVAVGGPAANILTAISIPLTAALIYGVPLTPSSLVASVADGGAAWNAGLRPGDRIISFNEADDPSFDRMTGDAALSPNIPLPMVVERNGQRISLTIKPSEHKDGSNRIGELDFVPDFGVLPVVVFDVSPDSPAAKAGLKAGDRIISIDSQPARNSAQSTEFIREAKQDQIRVTVERDGKQIELVSGVRRLENGRAQLGLKLFDDAPLQRVGIGGAISHAVGKNIEVMRLTKNALGQIFSGQRSARDTLAGPIGIARETARITTALGWAGVFGMLGFLSLNLGVFNLLPIPVLDGGAIFMLLVEGVCAVVGLTISMTMRERIQQAGMVVLLLLMGFVITNDLLKFYSDKWGANRPPAATAPSK